MPSGSITARWRFVALGALAVALAAGVALWAGSGPPGPPSVAAGPDSPGGGIRLVAPEAAAATLADLGDRAVVLDVRTPAEFAKGHLAGAVLVDFKASDFRSRIAELDRDEPYVVYCHSGNRSAGAVAVMRDLGFSDVTEVAGGIAAWKATGLPVTTT